MITIDLSGIAALIPIFGFLLVFTVTYALLSKTKVLGENKFISILVSFVVSIIFIVSANAITYVRTITPWFAVFIVSLLFIVLTVGLVKKNVEDFFKPAFGWFIVIALLLIFVLSAIFLFSNILGVYFAPVKEFVVQPQVLGIVILLAVAVFASWLLTKGK